MPTTRRPLWPFAGVAVAALLILAGCAGNGGPANANMHVTATMGIIADLVKQVGGDRVDVTSIVPTNGDPHSYEPTPEDAKKVAKADVVFTNGMLLEEQSITKLVGNTIRKGAPKVALAEQAEKHGGSLSPLREDLGLSVLWLGLAVEGDLSGEGAEVKLAATKVEGPGKFAVFLTEALGTPKIYYNSDGGLGDKDVVSLPPAAHTHVNWAFSERGIYRVTLSASVNRGGGKTQPLGEGTYTFAVGVPPTGGVVLDHGHADLAVDVNSGKLIARSDDKGHLPADQVVLSVPDETRSSVPNDPQFAFLGQPGSGLWILPQAVLGKHVHGEVDPHLWQDVTNTMAYVTTVQETLSQADPAGRDSYERRARSYLDELAKLDQYVAGKVATIPEQNRRLITTHDAFGYFGKKYGLQIVGFVVPNPGQEPSAAAVATLNDTVVKLHIPAVFVEPNLAARADVLRRVANDHKVAVCVVYGDAFDNRITTYTAMMRHNTDEIVRCLGGTGT